MPIDLFFLFSKVTTDYLLDKPINQGSFAAATTGAASSQETVPF